MVTLAVNDTLAISLSNSWEPASVQIDVTAKPSGVPIPNCESLWPDPDGTSFYSFGGDPSNSLAGPVLDFPVDLWQFKAQTWSRVSNNWWDIGRLLSFAHLVNLGSRSQRPSSGPTSRRFSRFQH